MSIIALKFSKNQYRKMLDDEITEYDFISEILKARSEKEDADFNTICFELQSNHSGDGGAPEVDDFEISEIIYNRFTKMGTVYLNYEIYFYWGCNDMNNSQEANEICEFTLDVKNLELQMHIPDTLSRSTFEEF